MALAVQQGSNDDGRGSAKTEPREVILLVDESIYSKEALLRACYWFTDRCYLFVSRPGPNQFSVRIRAKAGLPSLESISGDFENALIDHQVRQDVERDTARLRELIVAKAFAEGDLEDAPIVMTATPWNGRTFLKTEHTTNRNA